jgi:hypothetical protein
MHWLLTILIVWACINILLTLWLANSGPWL